MGFGLKIMNVEKHREHAKEILKYANEHDLWVECGFAFTADFSDIYAKTPPQKVQVHINQRKYSIFNFPETQDTLQLEVDYYKQLGATYGVIHLTLDKSEADKYPGDRLLEVLPPGLFAANEFCKKNDFELYIENTYHSVDFYKDLFRMIRKAGWDRLHFTFDVGHAKVWSGAPVSNWLNFLDEREKLHFHLHCNAGKHDQHLSLLEYDGEGDWFSNGVSYIDLFKSLEYRYPDFLKVFEVKQEFAIPNIEYVINEMRKCCLNWGSREAS